MYPAVVGNSQGQSELPPPALLGLAGYPVQWRVLGELAFSDRAGALGDRPGGPRPQNLVSYHLGRLRKANLVTARFAQPGGATGAVTVLHGKFYQMGLM